jgi:hypothetical protein
LYAQFWKGFISFLCGVCHRQLRFVYIFISVGSGNGSASIAALTN